MSSDDDHHAHIVPGYRPMGRAPSLDALPPAEQATDAVDASFPPSPTGLEICGFALPAIPDFPGFPGLNLPGLDTLFAFPPAFSFPIPITCSAGESFADSVGYGGGRTPSRVPAIDQEFEDG
jgi:hypothetical protein